VQFGDPRLQCLGQRQQARLKRLALGYVVAGPAQPWRVIAVGPNDLPLHREPMDATIGMGDAYFGAAGLALSVLVRPGGRDRRAQFQEIVGEDDTFPFGEGPFGKGPFGKGPW
jgi:hypothetical protein